MAKRSKNKKKDKSRHPAAQQQTQQHQLRQIRATQEIFEGPLPKPEILQEFDNIVPGAAERIIVMAEEQAAHRQKLEYIVVKSGSRDSLLGLICGFIIGIVTIGCGTYCIQAGQPAAGTILGGTGLSSLVGVFIYGSRQRKAERESKRQNQ